MRKKYGVIIFHGFSANLNSIENIRSKLHPLDIPILSPVLCGHGQDSPDSLRDISWQQWIEDAEKSMKEMHNQAEKIIIIGHSMGGLLALYLASKYKNDIDSIVLAAAPIKLNSIFAPFGSMHFLTPLLLTFGCKHNMNAKYYSEELLKQNKNYRWVPFKALKQLFKLIKVTEKLLPEINCPVLLLQSYNDTIVAKDTSTYIYDNISTNSNDKQLVWFEKTEHQMFLDVEQEGCTDSILKFVKSRIS